jgi:putative PEP-CTERM system TPR-repeat lipoprotein
VTAGRTRRALFASLACLCGFAGGLLAGPAARGPDAALAQGVDVAAAQKYQAEADRLIANGDFKAAHIALRNARTADPHNPRIRIALAGVELHLEDLAGAQANLEAARQAGGDEATIIPLLGSVYLLQRKYDELLALFPDRDAAPPAIRARILTERAKAQLGLGQLDQGRASLQLAEQLDPQAEDAELTMARVDFVHQAFDSALAEVDAALRIHATADGHFLKGEILLQKHDETEGLHELDQAIALDRGNFGALTERAQIYLHRGDDAKASEDVKAADALHVESVTVRYLQATLLARAKKFAEANALWTKYAATDPGFVPGRYLQAVIKTELGQYEQAETAIESYLAAAPNDARAATLRAEILMRTGRFPVAVAALTQLAARFPRDAMIFALLGEAYTPLDPASSAEAFAQAATLAPQTPAKPGASALGDETTDRAMSVAAELERVLARTPNDAGAAQALAIAEIQQRKFADAGTIIADLIRQRPDDPVPADLRGMLELVQYHVEAARTIFETVAVRFPDFIPVKLQLAKLYEADGDHDQARALYEAILQQHPDNLTALGALSANLVRRNQSAKVLALWEQAYREHPGDLSVGLNLAHAYALTFNIDRALATLEILKVGHPEPPVFQLIAELAVQKGALAEAEAALGRLAVLQPRDPAPMRGLAMVQAKAGNMAGAVETIAAARRRDPKNALLALDEAVLLGAGDPDQGIAATQRFAASQPLDPAAQAVEGDYLMTLNRAAEALAVYQRNLAAHPSAFLAGRVAQAATANAKPAVAQAALTDWVTAHPQDLIGRQQLASFLMAQRAFPAAKALYADLLRDDPNNPAALNNLAVIYAQDNDPQALDLARKAVLGAPDNPQVADTLGWVMAGQGDAAGGAKVLTRAHNMLPGDPTIQYHLAFALNATGRKAEAVDLLKQAVAPGSAFADKAKAQALLEQLSRS